MIILGLTGSIGMGKSTCALLLRRKAVPVFDADGCVHQLYQQPDIINKIEQAFPNSTSQPTKDQQKSVDRVRLAAHVLGDQAALLRLEQLIHPMIWQRENHFISESFRQGHRLIVLENPLLLEKARQKSCDVVVVASAPEAIQRARVLARPHMNIEKWTAITAQQMPDQIKRQQAHFVLDTSRDIVFLERQISHLLRVLAPCCGQRKNDA